MAEQRASSTGPLSIAVLAGGDSTRMQGEDKAFIKWKDMPFIRKISNQMLQVSDDVLVVIGNKDEKRFTENLPRDVVVSKDRYNFGTPVSGMLSACELAKHPYIAIVGCDMPLIRASVIRYLNECALGHSAAVPKWENGETEPLCSVYKVEEFKRAALQAERQSAMGCKEVIEYLQDVNFVPVFNLRKIDPKLESLRNINSREDLNSL
jgi:molybdenum cofactor guanylyltransferase